MDWSIQRKGGGGTYNLDAVRCDAMPSCCAIQRHWLWRHQQRVDSGIGSGCASAGGHGGYLDLHLVVTETETETDADVEVEIPIGTCSRRNTMRCDAMRQSSCGCPRARYSSRRAVGTGQDVGVKRGTSVPVHLRSRISSLHYAVFVGRLLRCSCSSCGCGREGVCRRRRSLATGGSIRGNISSTGWRCF